MFSLLIIVIGRYIYKNQLIIQEIRNTKINLPMLHTCQTKTIELGKLLKFLHILIVGLHMYIIIINLMRKIN